MSSLVKILAFLPLALAANPVVLNPRQAMIFRETDFAVKNDRRGMEVPSDGTCMNLDVVQEYRMNVGSIHVPCPSSTHQDMLCTVYNDNSCRNEIVTFARPHANMLKQSNNDVGSHIKSIRCMTVRSPLDRQGRIFTSDHPSTKNPSTCPNDNCSKDMDCQSVNPNYHMICSKDSMTCQPQARLGGFCTRGLCPSGVCVNGLCAQMGENLPCLNRTECPAGHECRPSRVVGMLGTSVVDKVCMKTDDVRGKQCSSTVPCVDHMMCSLHSEGNMYCEWNGTCGLTDSMCVSSSQCCSGKCNASKCQN